MGDRWAALRQELRRRPTKPVWRVCVDVAAFVVLATAFVALGIHGGAVSLVLMVILVGMNLALIVYVIWAAHVQRRSPP